MNSPSMELDFILPRDCFALKPHEQPNQDFTSRQVPLTSAQLSDSLFSIQVIARDLGSLQASLRFTLMRTPAGTHLPG